MKKLYIILLGGLIASSVHAASFSWSAYEIPNAASANALTVTGLTASLYCTALAQTELASTTVLYSSSYGNYISLDDIRYDVTEETSELTFYFTVVGTDQDGQSWTYTSSDYVAKLQGAGTVSLIWEPENNAGTWAKTNTVPEPTSGLLFLLGMAGLALRRKRA